MTIVAGFRCWDGVVLCTDTEHSAGYSKFQKRKIQSYSDEYCKIHFAGSGSSDYLDMAIEKITGNIPSGEKNIRMIKQSFEEVALDIQNRHIKPFFEMQDQYRPQIGLLAIVHLKKTRNTEIVKISDTTVSSVEDYDVLGTGEHLARSLIDWLYEPQLSTRLMRIIAINIVQQTKKYVGGVGGSTHVVSLMNQPETYRRSTLYDDSEFFFGLQKPLRELLFAALDSEVNDLAFSKCQQELAELFDRVRQTTKQQQDLESRLFKKSKPDEEE